MRKLFTPLLGLAIAAGAFAQDQDADPPSRAARLSYINGNVSFQPGGVDDWVPAEPNRPLTTGDRLWSDANSRVELNLGSSTFRLNSRTNFTFLNLDDRMAQIQLSLGTLNVRVRRLADDETIEIDTPQAAFTLLRPGEYRLEVNEQGDATIVTVRGGEIEATANGQAFPIHAREWVRISGPEGAQPVFDRRAAPPSDSFDNFCQDRDRREDLSQSARYVSRDMPGYADLDANGSWSNDPQYGAVWVPTSVAVGWSPYHFGHWAWIAPWGYTWIDDAPWGYAPFHYGRWAMVGGGRWGWCPGPVAVRPVYAPAMVAFVGGGGFSASISIGGGGAAVGWFPLGPREVWVPSYHVSPAYMTRVNVTNTVVTEVNVRNVYTNVYVNKTVVNNVYVNQRVPGAVVAVRSDAMVGGRHIDAAVAVRVPPAAVENVQVMHAAPVAPERNAVLGGRAPVSGGHLPPPALVNRPMVAKAAPPPAPVPFARQQEALRANPGRPLDPVAVRNMQAAQPVARPNIRQSVPGPAAPRGSAPVNANRPAPVANPPAVNSPAAPPAVRPEVRPVPPRPDPARPEVNRPETPPPAPRPESRPVPRPEPVRPEVNRPVMPPPANPRPEPARPEPARPEARPAPRPEPVRPEVNRPATPPPTPRAEPVRPEPARPEARPVPRPEPVRPEVNRPATPPPAPRAEPVRPEPARPEARPAPRPEVNRPAPPPPAPRQEAPRPETARPAPPPAPREERQQPPRSEKPAEQKKKTDKDK